MIRRLWRRVRLAYWLAAAAYPYGRAMFSASIVMIVLGMASLVFLMGRSL
jgi:hypothetical protein